MLIRISEQPGGDAAQQEAVQKVRDALGDDVDYRRVEVVGPSVSTELLSYGTIGLVLAIGAILIYLWFRFEWQFALGAMIANVHDLVLTVGFMSLTQIDFDLTSIAALLTILGYSLNDTVVIYDRIREMLRRYKRMPMPDLLNASINATLSRSIVTHVTVSLSLLALLLFGGQAIRSFTATMMFGVVLVGTYTSVFIASPILIYLGVGRTRQGEPEGDRNRGAADRAASAAVFAESTAQARPGAPLGSLQPFDPVRLAAMQDAFAYCAELVRTADRDRFIATLFAPVERAGRAARALCLQCRACARSRRGARGVAGRNPPAMVESMSSAASAAGRRMPIRSRRRCSLRSSGMDCRARALLDLIEARRFDLYDDRWRARRPRELCAKNVVGDRSRSAHGSLRQRRRRMRRSLPASRMPSPALLRALPLHLARRPALCAGRAVGTPSGPAARPVCRPIVGRPREALAELRRSRAPASGGGEQVREWRCRQPAMPAFLPVALVRPALDRLERSDPFAPAELPPWRRQWLIWRAARNPARIAG